MWREPVDISAMAVKDLAKILAANGYVVERRTGDTSEWIVIGETGFAADASTLTTILGTDLMSQLGYDLRDS